MKIVHPLSNSKGISLAIRKLADSRRRKEHLGQGQAALQPGMLLWRVIEADGTQQRFMRAHG